MCNSLQPSAASVTLQCSSNPLPTPKGGTIVDGVYVLASATYYGSPCPTPEVDRDRWLVCGTNWQTLQDYTLNGGTDMANADDFNVTQNGTTIQLQGTCGVTSSYSFEYDATPTTLSLYITTPSTPGQGRVDVYSRQ